MIWSVTSGYAEAVSYSGEVPGSGLAAQNGVQSGGGAQSGSLGWFLQQTPLALQPMISGMVGSLTHPVTVVQGPSADAGMMNGLAVYGTMATINMSMN